MTPTSTTPRLRFDDPSHRWRYNPCMCGRFLITDPDEALRQLFDYDGPPTGFDANYNVAPTTLMPIVRQGTETRHLLSRARWGLIPSWAKDETIASKLINARSETLLEKPSYRTAFRHRRCLIPAEGFYEWQGQGKGPKQPYMIAFEDRQPFAFAGLWERWEKGDTPVTTFTIITTEAAPAIQDIHHRMPVILAKDQFANWLDVGGVPAEEAQQLLGPWAEDGLTAWPVSTRVNNVRNNDADLVEVAAI